MSLSVLGPSQPSPVENKFSLSLQEVELLRVIQYYSKQIQEKSIMVQVNTNFELLRVQKIQASTCIINEFDLFQMLPCLFVIKWLCF